MKASNVFQVIVVIIISRMMLITCSGISSINANEGSSIQPNHHFNLCCPLPSKMIGYDYTNATGYPLPNDGMFSEMFDWISHRYGFTFTCTHLVFDLEKTGKDIGALHYMNLGECDVRPSALTVRYNRFQVIDFIQPFWSEPAALIIPSPSAPTNFSAIWRSFQYPVWILLVIAATSVTFVLIFLDAYFGGDGRRHFHRARLDLHGVFTTSILVGQSGFFTAKTLKMRMVGGAWCLAALVLVTAYSSVLVSFYSAPIYQPLIGSMEELSNRDDVNLVVLKYFAADRTLSSSGGNEITKKLSKKLDANPNGRCSNISQCYQQVKMGSTVLIQSIGPIFKALVSADFRQSDVCGTTLVPKETFGSFVIAWGITKQNRHTETYNRAILQMVDMGLIAAWVNPLKEESGSNKCTFNDKVNSKENKDGDVNSLTLKNLMGPFVILPIGYLISLLVFLGERMVHHFRPT